jgi:hypothetical protein
MQHCFSESWTHFDFLTFALHFMLNPGPNPVPEQEPECIKVPVPLSIAGYGTVRLPGRE